MGRVLPEAKLKNKCTLFFELFLFERPLLTRDWKSESVTNGPTNQLTNQLTWVGARDTCVSKNHPVYVYIVYIVCWQQITNFRNANQLNWAINWAGLCHTILYSEHQTWYLSNLLRHRCFGSKNFTQKTRESRHYPICDKRA